MKKIALVNRNVKFCGIYGYTMSAYTILNESQKYHYELHLCNLPQHAGVDESVAWVDSIDADAVIFNWCPYTMHWLKPEVMYQLRDRPYLVISGHDYTWTDLNHPLPVAQRTRPNFVWSVDPTFAGFITPELKFYGQKLNFSEEEMRELARLPNYGALPRPVIDYKDLQYREPNWDHIVVGTFGFSATSKGYDQIIRVVNEDLADVPKITLRLYATHGQWQGYDPTPGDKLANKIRDLANPNVTVEIMHEFIEDPYILAAKLNELDAVIFIYDYFIGSEGTNKTRSAVSSSLDHGLASKKPVALNRSKMFSHVWDIPEIFLENNTLKDIIKRGTKPLEPVYNRWTHEVFRGEVESKLDKFLENSN